MITEEARITFKIVGVDMIHNRNSARPDQMRLRYDIEDPDCDIQINIIGHPIDRELLSPLFYHYVLTKDMKRGVIYEGVPLTHMYYPVRVFQIQRNVLRAFRVFGLDTQTVITDVRRV